AAAREGKGRGHHPLRPHAARQRPPAAGAAAGSRTAGRRQRGLPGRHGSAAAIGVTGKAMRPAMVVIQAPMRQLELVREAKVFDILGKRLDARLEASGVLAKDGLFYVIFDNLPHIARIGPELSPAATANAMIRQQKGHGSGFEDIAYDAWHGRFYVLIESLPRDHGTYMAKVQE